MNRRADIRTYEAWLNAPWTGKIRRSRLLGVRSRRCKALSQGPFDFIRFPPGGIRRFPSQSLQVFWTKALISQLLKAKLQQTGVGLDHQSGGSARLNHTLSIAAYDLKPTDAANASSACDDRIFGYLFRSAFFNAAMLEGTSLIVAWNMRRSVVLSKSADYASTS